LGVFLIYDTPHDASIVLLGTVIRWRGGTHNEATFAVEIKIYFMVSATGLFDFRWLDAERP
jgi:hypothetical protein